MDGYLALSPADATPERCSDRPDTNAGIPFNVMLPGRNEAGLNTT
jgi:hypothetical protein